MSGVSLSVVSSFLTFFLGFLYSTTLLHPLILNTGVTIAGQTGEWYKVVYGDYLGYIYKPLISETPTATSRGNEVRQPENTQEQTTVENNEQTKI